jgi:hypothetical protein
MKAKFLATAAIAACTTLSSVAADWKLLSTSSKSGMKLEVNLDSVDFAKDANGKPSGILYDGRFRTTSGTISFTRWGVAREDCLAGYGILFSTDLDGKNTERNEFYLDGGTVASSVADFMCGVFLRALKKSKEAEVSPASYRSGL